MKRNSNKTLKLLSFFGIIVAIYITTIGYSVYNSYLTISGEGLVKVDYDIRIVNLNVSSVESGTYEQYNNNYGPKSIFYNIVLPNADSSITYKVDIKNRNSRDYGIANLIGLPDNLTYEFVNYNVGNKVCTNSTCNNGVTDELYLKIKYAPNGYDSTNVNYSGSFSFDFEYFYDVIYQNVAGSSSLSQKILKGATYQGVIPIPEGYKIKIRMNGVLLVKDDGYFYDTNTNTVTIPNVISSIVISIEEIGIEFDLTGTGHENSFSYLNTGYDINEMTFYLEADFSDCDLTDIHEGIISIGNNISKWEVGEGKPGGVNLHVYYPETANITNITIDLTYTPSAPADDGKYKLGFGKIQKVLNFSESSLFRMAFNANGLYINGERIFDENGRAVNTSTTIGNLTDFLTAYFNYWKTTPWNVDIGSIETNNRSNAVYHEIKIYNSLLTVQELIEKTTIVLEEAPIEEDVNYNSVSTVVIGNNPAINMVYPFQPNSNKFVFTNPSLTNLYQKSFYIEMDVSNLKSNANLENLISIGNNIPEWTATGAYDFHMYYPDGANTNTIILAFLNEKNNFSQFRATVSLIDDSLIKMVVCRNGIFINGEKWFDSSGYIKSGISAFGKQGSESTAVATLINKFISPNDDTFAIEYGSKQGDNRSTATYTDIRIYDGVLSELKSIALTS